MVDWGRRKARSAHGIFARAVNSSDDESALLAAHPVAAVDVRARSKGGQGIGEVGEWECGESSQRSGSPGTNAIGTDFMIAVDTRAAV